MVRGPSTNFRYEGEQGGTIKVQVVTHAVGDRWAPKTSAPTLVLALADDPTQPLKAFRHQPVRISHASLLVEAGPDGLHVGAIADNVIEEMKKEGVRPLNVEGAREARWVLVDYFDFVLHVFHPQAREFYQLERLWGDAPTHTLQAAG